MQLTNNSRNIPTENNSRNIPTENNRNIPTENNSRNIQTENPIEQFNKIKINRINNRIIFELQLCLSDDFRFQSKEQEYML